MLIPSTVHMLIVWRRRSAAQHITHLLHGLAMLLLLVYLNVFLFQLCSSLACVYYLCLCVLYTSLCAFTSHLTCTNAST